LLQLKLELLLADISKNTKIHGSMVHAGIFQKIGCPFQQTGTRSLHVLHEISTLSTHTEIYFFKINQLVKIATLTRPESVRTVKISNEGLKMFTSMYQS
jgi:hypothetical protein